MKRALTILAALSLSACTTGQVVSAIPAAPAAVANKTVLDEQAALGVELAYQAAALSLITATRAGLIKGDAATKAAALESRAYAAVLAVRGAYNTANADSYSDALVQARSLVAQIVAIVKGN